MSDRDPIKVEPFGFVGVGAASPTHPTWKTGECCPLTQDGTGRHFFEPFIPSDDLGGGAQKCRCGRGSRLCPSPSDGW